jgi:hypothetical protein
VGGLGIGVIINRECGRTDIIITRGCGGLSIEVIYYQKVACLVILLLFVEDIDTGNFCAKFML